MHDISLICLVPPCGNKMIKSVFALKDYLKICVSFPEVHFLCSVFGTHVEKDGKVCANKNVRKIWTQQDAVGYFIQHSVIYQHKVMC